MEVQLHDVRTNKERINRIWLDFEKCPSTAYFLSWGWVSNWLHSLPVDVDLKLAVGNEGKAPVWACFLGSRYIVRKHLVPARSLFLNATGIPKVDRLSIEYNKIFTQSPCGCSLWDILEELDSKLAWDEFVLPGLSVDEFPGNDLANCPSAWRLVIMRDDPSPYVDLGMVRSHGDYVSLLGRNARSQMRRCFRAYDEQGNITLDVPHDMRQALEIFEELVVLHQGRWRSMGCDGAFSNEYVYKFHKRLIQSRFPFGEIQLLRVRVGRQTVGCLYNFVFNGRVLFYQGGLSLGNDRRMKPGWLCHCEAIRHSVREGYEIYDFLAGESQYKYSLSTHENRIIWAKVQKSLLRFELERQALSVKRSMRSFWMDTMRRVTSRQ